MGGKGSKHNHGGPIENIPQKYAKPKDNNATAGTNNPGNKPDNVPDHPEELYFPKPGDNPIDSLKHAQGIISYLVCSKMHHYVPQDIWELPKFKEKFTDPGNVFVDNEDATEIYSTLLYDVDEVLKERGKCQISKNLFGSTFGSKRCCSICQHIYYKKEGYDLIHLDIPEMNDIYGSLNHFFRPKTIEYMCPNCKKMNKSDEIKYFKTLPTFLPIELMRYNIDWDKDLMIKVYDYLEFPTELDLSSYTLESDTPAPNNPNVTYKLTGILTIDSDTKEIIPMSETNNDSKGKFNSFVMYDSSGRDVWYKVEGNTVTECTMDEKLLKEKCFGGAETCSAYMLFYTKTDL